MAALVVIEINCFILPLTGSLLSIPSVGSGVTLVIPTVTLYPIRCSIILLDTCARTPSLSVLLGFPTVARTPLLRVRYVEKPPLNLFRRSPPPLKLLR